MGYLFNDVISVIQSIYRRMKGRYMNNELENYVEEAVVA